MNNDSLDQRLGIKPEELAAFCQRAKIQELALFGSILREDFNADSDVDCLISFEPGVRLSLLAFVDLEYQLQELLKRKVDLVVKSVVQQDPNYLRRDAILNHYEVIYESRFILSV